MTETATRRHGDTASHRPAFTLVEMIVVITIMLIVMVAAVAVAPRFQENQRTVKGADQISQWLLTAKVRAYHDQVPTGVRFNPDPANASFVRELQLVQQPDDLVVQPGVDLINSPQARRITITRYSGPLPNPPYYDLVDLEPVPPSPPFPPPSVVTDFSGGFGSNFSLWPVQVGDYLEIQGTGLVHRIIAPTNPATPALPLSSITLQLDPAGAPTSPISSRIRQYRIIRSPRVLTGETPLQLPKDVAIDASQKFFNDPFAFSPPVDIMFSPNGGVLNYPGVAGKIILWVRDTSKDPSEPGEQFLVVIQVRTGFIAVHPVDAYSSNLNMYRFAFDDRSSGL